MKPRIFVSVPDDRHLDTRRRRLKRAIVREIERLGFEVVGFEPEQFAPGRAANPDEWTVERAQALLQRCDGVLILALARRHIRVIAAEEDAGAKTSAAIPLPTTYNHLEGALGIALGIPTCLIIEAGMERHGIFNSDIKPVVLPGDATESWLKSRAFQAFLPKWAERVRERRDVFLGYCSKGSAVALKLRSFLEKREFTVLDWSRDFSKAGATILEEIERAATRCRCAVFLFTKDDEVAKAARRKANFKAVPRDNVLVEAGYFTRARGKARVAIIRQEGAKMPADFGGVIYLEFARRRDLSEVKAGLLKFLSRALSSDGTDVSQLPRRKARGHA
jgi:predicted nucleotide-binding protein